jgi:hypothetical protein
MLVVALGGFLLWGRIVPHIRIVDLDRLFTWCLIAPRWWPPPPFARLLLGARPFRAFRSIPTFVHRAHIDSPICSLDAADSLRTVWSRSVPDSSTLLTPTASKFPRGPSASRRIRGDRLLIDQRARRRQGSIPVTRSKTAPDGVGVGRGGAKPGGRSLRMTTTCLYLSRPQLSRRGEQRRAGKAWLPPQSCCSPSSRSSREPNAWAPP